jgi:LEA14-like dessication related protein
MKKIITAAAVLFTVLALSTCKTLQSVMQEPLISLHSVELASVNINGAQLLCKVQVENPNAFEIPFPETDWELFINANSFLSGVVKNNRHIGARQKTLVDVPVNLDYLGVFNSFRSLKGSQKAGYKIALGVKFPVSVFGEDKVWNFEHEGEFPLPQLPKLSAPSIRIESRDSTKVEILVTVNVENPNVFELPSFKIEYDYRLNRNSFIKGETGSAAIAAGAVTPVVFRLSVHYSDLFRSFASLIGSREVSGSISLFGDFGIPVFSGETFNLSTSGTLPLR